MNLLYFLDGFFVGVLSAALFWEKINIVDALVTIPPVFLGRLLAYLITKQVRQN
jgi:hypothetical protein